MSVLRPSAFLQTFSGHLARLSLAAALWTCASCLSFPPGLWAQTSAARPAATVLFSGDFSSGRLGPEIAAAPGVRFGMELVVRDVESAEPLVLTVRLKRPAPEGAPGEDVWQLAARPGQAVQASWEFAYAWEVASGAWEMEVFHEDAVLASARFLIARAPEGGRPPAAPEAAAPKDAKPSVKDAKTSAKDGKAVSKKDAAKTEQAAPTDMAGAKAGPGPKAESSPAAASAARQPGKAEPLNAPRPDKAAEAARPAPVKSELARPETAKPVPAKSESARPEAPKPEPPHAGKATGLAPDRKVYVLVAGSFSEQARGMWMAVLLKEQGVKACVRTWEKDGRRLWQLVAGWRATLDEAQAAKAELGVKVGEVIIVPMSAGELEKGLQCH